MHITRFILTMWYVNQGTRIYNHESSERFILTMWYVNDSKDKIMRAVSIIICILIIK